MLSLLGQAESRPRSTRPRSIITYWRKPIAITEIAVETRPMTSSLKPSFQFDPTCSCGSLRKATRRISQLYDDVLEPCGLKLSQYQLIVHIERRKLPPTMTELAKDMVIDKSALAHSLKPLERDGLVEQMRDQVDGRTRRVVLTPAGRTKIAKAKRLWKQAQERFEKAYGVEKTAALNEALEAIISDDFAAAFGI